MDHFETDLDQSRRGPVAWMAGRAAHRVGQRAIQRGCQRLQTG